VATAVTIVRSKSDSSTCSENRSKGSDSAWGRVFRSRKAERPVENLVASSAFRNATPSSQTACRSRTGTRRLHVELLMRMPYRRVLDIPGDHYHGDRSIAAFATPDTAWSASPSGQHNFCLALDPRKPSAAVAAICSCDGYDRILLGPSKHPGKRCCVAAESEDKLHASTSSNPPQVRQRYAS
jgi:hypothetical protein